MAGFYNVFDDRKKYVILTTAANESMENTHDRMPLILPDDLIQSWIADDSMVDEFLRMVPPLLTKKQEYEQLRFTLDNLSETK